VNLAGQVFFRDPSSAAGDDTAAPDRLPWLSGAALQLPDGADPDATLVTLGSTSMQVIALQYQILQRTVIDVAIDDLLGDRTVREVAALLAKDHGTKETEAAQDSGQDVAV
jgi:methionyl-tRNA synthetase